MILLSLLSVKHVDRVFSAIVWSTGTWYPVRAQYVYCTDSRKKTKRDFSFDGECSLLTDGRKLRFELVGVSKIFVTDNSIYGTSTLPVVVVPLLYRYSRERERVETTGNVPYRNSI